MLLLTYEMVCFLRSPLRFEIENARGRVFDIFPLQHNHAKRQRRTSPRRRDCNKTSTLMMNAVEVGERSPFRKISENEAVSEENNAHNNKRLKVDDAATTTADAPIDYPAQVAIPCKGLVHSLYETAYADETTDQAQVLTDAGLLSLQHVLLPAVAYQEDEALKQLQAVVQRDDPNNKPAILACRKAVYDGIHAAMAAVDEARTARRVVEVQREAEWAAARERAQQQKRQQQARRAEQKNQERAIQRAKRKSELVKKLPRNQELWREVVYLMTEMSKLQKEERLWKEAKERLEKREEEVAASEAQQQSLGSSDDAEDAAPESSFEPCADMEKVTQTVQDITVSSVRIHQALNIVSEIATESERVRKELHERYRRDHQFHGYQGVKDPKGLLRALSQSQDIE